MISILEYLLSKDRKLHNEATIKATDDNIYHIVKDEINRLGNEADLNHIDVSEVTNMHHLFSDSDFNGDISEWDVSKVTDMNRMFYYSEFNGDISKWNINKDTKIYGIFHNCPLEKNPPAWYTR